MAKTISSAIKKTSVSTRRTGSAASKYATNVEDSPVSPSAVDQVLDHSADEMELDPLVEEIDKDVASSSSIPPESSTGNFNDMLEEFDDQSSLTSSEDDSDAVPSITELKESVKLLEVAALRASIKFAKCPPTHPKYAKYLAAHNGALSQLTAARASLAIFTGPEVSTGASAPTMPSTVRKESVATNTDNSLLVPSELRLFQWKGHIIHKNGFHHKSAASCLKHFETILASHGLRLEVHWGRLLPTVLTDTMSKWYDDLLVQHASLTWMQFKSYFLEEFGIPPAEERARAYSKLMSFSIGSRTMKQHLAKFYELKQASGITESGVLTYALLRSVDAEVFEEVSRAAMQQDFPLYSNVDTLTKFLRKAYDLVIKRDKRQDSSSAVPHRDNRSNRSSSSRGQYCHFHESTSHDISRCKAFAKAKQHRAKMRHPDHHKQSGSSPIQKKCPKCFLAMGNGFHRCQKKGFKSQKSANKTKRSIVPRRSSSKNDASSSSASSSSSDEDEGGDQNLAFAASSRSIVPSKPEKMKIDCKYDTAHSFKELPAKALSSQLIHIPIIIENVKCWALLDPGSNFSAISPSLASYLQLNIINKENKGQITLGNDNSITRNGTTEHELEIIYMNKVLYSKLEVFTVIHGLHAHIGTDLMYKLGITVTNIALTWGEIQKPALPVIEPNPYTPNDDPFFSDKDHKYLLQQIQPYIEANMNIPIRNYCTIPGSEIRLPLKKGVIRAYRRQYPIAECHIDAVNEQIQKWIDADIVERAPPNNPFNSPLLTVPKKNARTGEYTGDIRTVIDSRLVNASLDPKRVDRFPLPLISDLHRKMSQYTLFTTLDLSQCFHSFRIRKRDRRLTAFTTPDGVQLQFKRSPFGLLPISSVVQRSLTNAFADLPYCINFIDDYYIMTDNDMETHINCVQTVIERLTKFNLRINPDKIHLAQRSIYVLGFCLSEKGLFLDQRKVANVLDWPVEVSSARELSHRLGVLTYFHTHIPNFSTLAAPLNELRNHPNLSEVWTKEHSLAMRKLQEALVNAPILNAPNLKYDFYLVTDASAYGIGGVLYQVINDTIHYNGFVARTLTKTERNYGSSRRELLAVVYCFTKWRQWLYGKHFHLFVDNKALLALHTQDKTNRMIEAYYETIFEMDFDITYCAGMRNVLADDLSRLFYPDAAQTLAGGDSHNSTTSSNIKKKENKAFTTSPKNHIPDSAKPQNNASHNNESSNDTNDVDHIMAAAVAQTTLHNTPENDDEKHKIIEQCHLLGHYGISSTERAIKEEYGMNWLKLRDDVTDYIKNCAKCSRYNLAKHVFHAPKSICPDGAWDQIAIDLGTFDVTTANGNNFLLVIVDLFTRFVILKPIKNKTALDVARELVSVFSIMGYPKCIIHDNGLEFKNKLLKSISHHMGLEQSISLPYTPTGNSVAESAVASAKRIIVKMLNGYDASWDLYVDGATYAINQHVSRLHGLKPFEVMFNRQANDLKDYTAELNNTVFSEDTIDVEELKKKIERFNNFVIPEVREQILETQRKDNAKFMKKNQRRILKEPFPIGSIVRVKNIEGKKRKTDANYTDQLTVHGITPNGSYILKDSLGNLFSRKVPTSQIKLISKGDKVANSHSDDTYEVQSIINHRYKKPDNTLEYLTTWVGYPDEQTWLSPSAFNDPQTIKDYWKMQNVNSHPDDKNNRRKTPSSKFSVRENRNSKRSKQN